MRGFGDPVGFTGSLEEFLHDGFRYAASGLEHHLEAIRGINDQRMEVVVEKTVVGIERHIT